MLSRIRHKVEANERLSAADGEFLFSPEADLHAVGELADVVRRRKNGDAAYYNLNLHINPTNVCIYRCALCAYSRDEDDPAAYVMTQDEILAKNVELYRAQVKLTQDQLTALHKQVSVDQVEPAKAVKAWLAANGLTTGTSGTGKTVVVGSTNFYEQEILGELFSQLLEANGFTVTRKFNLGNREVVYPALKSGQIDLLAEYAATLLEYVNKSAGEATTDAAATVAKLKTRLAADGLTALDPAPATDQNGFVVTQATATKYGLSSLSDLAKPAP